MHLVNLSIELVGGGDAFDQAVFKNHTMRSDVFNIFRSCVAVTMVTPSSDFKRLKSP